MNWMSKTTTALPEATTPMMISSKSVVLEDYLCTCGKKPKITRETKRMATRSGCITNQGFEWHEHTREEDSLTIDTFRINCTCGLRTKDIYGYEIAIQSWERCLVTNRRIERKVRNKWW